MLGTLVIIFLVDGQFCLFYSFLKVVGKGEGRGEYFFLVIVRRGWSSLQFCS